MMRKGCDVAAGTSDSSMRTDAAAAQAVPGGKEVVKRPSSGDRFRRRSIRLRFVISRASSFAGMPACAAESRLAEGWAAALSGSDQPAGSTRT
jgi:hypothetical protein